MYHDPIWPDVLYLLVVALFCTLIICCCTIS